VATAGVYHDAFATIRDHWSLDELYAADEYLTARAEAESEAYERARVEAKAANGRRS
jgi:hypothetical protein